MPEPVAVTIPLLNPNEPEAQMAAVFVSEGQTVAKGDVLCTLETTKSAADLSAEAEGYIVGLRFSAGQAVRAGEVLCWLADTPDWQPPAAPPSTSAQPKTAVEPPGGLRISQKALALVQERGLDLGLLPSGVFITESMVRLALEQAVQPVSAEHAPFDPHAILVYGGGGHGKSLIDLLRSLGTYRIVGIIDDGLRQDGGTILGLPILGGAEALPALYQQGVHLAVNAVGGIGNVSIRIQVFERLRLAGFTCPAVVHPSAVVEPSAQLAGGVQVFPLAYVGSEAQVGFGAIINTGAIVSHDCRLGDYVNCSPGAILAGEVQVGSAALIGMAATVNLRTRIGSGARIGNSATVKGDVPEGGLVRAGTIWPV
jgi:acetyltransferase EpsM